MTGSFELHLPADAQALVDEYLRSVRAAMSGLDPQIVDETVDGLLAHLTEELRPGATAAAVQAALSDLGPADAFAPASAAGALEEQSSAAAGTLLGMPYDLRIPTPERVASRWWNPSEPRILMPRVFGLGWSVNFGALAVRLNLIEPDAEESPFASVPQAAFLGALALPVVFTVAIAVSFLVMRESLPAQLPTHWGLSGRPDDFADRGTAFGLLLAMAALPTAYAVGSVLLKRPPLNRGVAIAFAAFFAGIAASVWAITLVTVLTPVVSPWLQLPIVMAAFLTPAAVLVFLARAGRAADIRSDLGR